MQTQSRTYNNGTILEFIYTIVPKNGKSYKQSVFINTSNGELIDYTNMILILDEGSENKFQGICCTIIPEDNCEGWITESGICWSTENGLSWAV